MRCHSRSFEPDVSFKVAEQVDAYAINYLRWLAARGFDAGLADMIFAEHRIVSRLLRIARTRIISDLDFDGLPGSVDSSTSRRVLKKLRALTEHPPRAVGSLEAPVGANLRLFADSLGLSGEERAVLQFLVVVDLSLELRQLVSSLRLRGADLTSMLSGVTGVERSAMTKCLSRDAVLFRSGLVRPATEGDPLPMSLDRRVVNLVTEPELDARMVLARFLSREPGAKLSLADFAPLRAELEGVVSIIRGAKHTRAAGLNFLFYGDTGVGKTEAARVIAAQLGVDLYLATGGDDFASPTPGQRLASLGFGNSMLKQARDLMLFDELEDLVMGLGPANEPDASKLWLNRFLETNPVPTIWTSNSLRLVDPAVLRRFTLAVRFPPFTERQRRQAWSTIAGDALAPAELDVLSRDHELSPADIASAVRAARLSGAETGEVKRDVLALAIKGAEESRGLKTRPATRAGSDYRLEAVNANRDLAELADRLSQWRPGADVGLTLCLYGRSGTGKSEFVHALARRMDRPLVVRNASDLLSKWVGETEHRIADAFASAARDGAILLLDEADTFLGERTGLQHSWERSQVNEFLQQLEATRGFVAVTTNLFRELDQAVLRRFTFKVEFLPLRPDQRVLLWDAHLARFLAAPPPDGAVARALAHLDELVPGDFGVVARRVAVLQRRLGLPELVQELSDELATRRRDSGRAIGFRDDMVRTPAQRPSVSASVGD